MAELVLSTLGRSLGARLPGAFGAIGAAALQAGGAQLGRAIDQRLFGPSFRREGARLADLHIQASTEGASIPAVYGRMRLAGQVIWAARFKERTRTEESGGKGGPRVTTRTYSYTLSFAIGLCEGEVARIGRVWANGEELDLSRYTWRLHTGSEHQAPDALIEAIEGAERAPAYRGLAYIVFEDMPLEAFGNIVPQLSFEIVRPARTQGPRLEDRVKSICLIPGAGEFVYETEPVYRTLGPGQEIAENVHAESARANVLVSLDQLQADFPNLETVFVITAWFGTDLRCGQCEIKPGVEIGGKATTPKVWRVGGLTREAAHVVSLADGAPAYGGTPSDESVLGLIAELKARGYKVGLYPFLLMDVPAQNTLPDPYGAHAQPAYPWRGRITLDPAPGRPGTPDKTPAAAAQIASFFGAATATQFSVSGGAPFYSGPHEWSYRRFILHYAKLASLAGVDAFVLGSEMRALTSARDGASSFPAVQALRAIAAEARAMLGPAVAITYAADWSEYSGYRPQDGSNDVFHHLDPLWADDNIDVVGIDWYPPLTDWRDGGAHADASLAASIYDQDYLKSRIEAGENYDWFYADSTARAAQARTPIIDSAYNEPWAFRAKDVRNFWSRSHYDRPAGVRNVAPTAWVPESKPIWFLELGCPAVDKGANAPNAFIDPKSSESLLPPFSSGARDDQMQRRTLDAYLTYWDASDPSHPRSELTGKPMIELISLWCWDARPHPAFPARRDVWADGGSWRLGHWLNGRAGLSDLGAVARHLCARAGLSEIDVSGLTGAVNGYIVEAQQTVRAALEPLMLAFDFHAVERDGVLTFQHKGSAPAVSLDLSDLTELMSEAVFAERSDVTDAPREVRLRFLDPARDYLLASVSARGLDRADGAAMYVDAPLALEPDVAEAIAQRLLTDQHAALSALSIELSPAHIALGPGDQVLLQGFGGPYEVQRTEDAETRRLEMIGARGPAAALVKLADPAPPMPPVIAPTPVVAVLDLPPLPGDELDERPLAAVFAAPWAEDHVVFAGLDMRQRARVQQSALMGELEWALWPGPVGRWDDGNVVQIKMYGGALSSAEATDVLSGANLFAIEAGGEWEIIQARQCILVGEGAYRLSGFLRGQLGSAHAMRAPHPVGARIVKIDEKLVRLDLSAHEWGEPLNFIVPPAGGAVSDLRASRVNMALSRVHARPWAPAHLRARRQAQGDLNISWIRSARIGGDAWGAAEPPLGASSEIYVLEVWDGPNLVRTVTLASPYYLYPVALQAEDFGQMPASFRVQVKQIGDGGATGLNAELTITL